MLFIIWYGAKSDKKRNTVFSTSILERMVFKKGGNYMPNECIWSRLLFCIYFSIFCWKPYFTKYKSKWHYYAFLSIFTLMNYKWPNFWYLKCIFKLNVIIGCIYALFLFILSEPNMLTFFSSPHYKYLGILIYFRLKKWSCFL